MQEMPPSKEDKRRGETSIALMENKKDRNGTTKQKSRGSVQKVFLEQFTSGLDVV